MRARLPSCLMSALRAICAVGLLASLAASMVPGRALAQPGPGGPPAVGTVAVVRKAIVDSNEFVGRVQSVNRVDLVARVTAFLEQRLFTEGAEVARGDVLYRLERGPFEAELNSKKAATAQAEALLRNSGITLGRAQSLLNTPAGQRSTVDDATAQRDSQAAQVAAARAQQESAQINLDYTEIKAPVAGKISRTAVTEGNVVSPTSGVLATIVSQDPMYVLFPVSVRTAIDLRARYADKGGVQAVTVKLRLPDGGLYGQAGKLDYVDPTVSANTDTLTFRAVMPTLVERLLTQSGSLPTQVADRLGSMRNAANRGATLTRQLLAFSRRQRLEPQTVDFNEIVTGIRDLLQTTLGGSVNLQTELATDLWPARVDPTQIEMVILNLAINARDAMEVGGSLKVQTANCSLRTAPARPEEPEPGDYVALSVQDTGSGMPDEVLAKAFEPFFTTKQVGKGSGLGLAQVYGFAKQSGGGVRIDTRPGHGTTVHVYLPRAAAGATEAPLAAPVAAPGVARRDSARTLLLVDDDDAVREATAALLAMHGFRIAEAADGPGALAQARARPDIDAVIADFAMPKMNGAELARQLRVLRPDLPLLFMTGFAELGALDDVPEDFVLQKPIGEAELLARLNRLLPN